MVDERNVFYIFHATQKTVLYNGGLVGGSLLLRLGEGETA